MNYEGDVVYRGNADGKYGRSAKQCWVVPVSVITDKKITIGKLSDNYLKNWESIVEDSKSHE